MDIPARGMNWSGKAGQGDHILGFSIHFENIEFCNVMKTC